MAIAKQVSKKDILECLQRAYDATLVEQDRYREIIDIDSGEVSEVIKQRVLNEGWKAILDIMQDCISPPCNEDRKKHLHIDWNQTVTYLKLEKIQDKDVRSRTYFLSSLIEHTQRIRSLAMFVDRGATLHGRWSRVYGFWVHRSKMLIIHDEAVTMGINERAKRLHEVNDLSDKLADVLFADVWKDKPQSN